MATFDVERTLSELGLAEKIALTAGRDMWHTHPIPRLGIPSLRFSDGPNGVRGTKFFNGIPAACFPCATALGATWDVVLLRKVGNLLGLEAKAKGAHVILGPTINIQRSPLGGRGFESFSEDPLLSGLLSAAYCNGIQEEDIITTPKHFVCNDLEDHRTSVNAIVTQRALREIYLMPFMLTMRDSNPGALMTSYNKLNGTHCSENPSLLEDLLRKEWKWDGLVMSDWWGTYSTTEAILAGLDIEMPGPPRFRTAALLHAVASNKLSEDVIDERVRNILNLVKKASRSGIKEGHEEQGRNTPEDQALLRKVAVDSIVLMKNDEKILPFRKEKTIAVIGPNANVTTFCGGGSAALLPYYAITPLEGVASKCSDVRFEQGIYSFKELPSLGKVLKRSDGRSGIMFKVYNEAPNTKDRECIDELYLPYTDLYLIEYENSKIKDPYFYADAEGFLTPEKDGIWDFGVIVQGSARLYIDGEEVVDNATSQEPGSSFFGNGSTEKKGAIELKGGQTYRLVVSWGNTPTSPIAGRLANPLEKGGVRFGGCPRIQTEESIQQAVKLSSQVDQVVVFAGLNGEWESEGHDRKNMDLPPNCDDLISRVLDANPNTVVVLQSGTPVAMPWVYKAKSLVQAWYGGSETGNAIADVLFGDDNPSGKLSLSFPKRVQDNPAYLHSRAERGRTLYGEDIYVGYRFYENLDLDVQFPFGHGLSYSTFSQSDLKVTNNGTDLAVSVKVKNTSTVDGAEVVQVYVSQKAPSVSRPPKELKGFVKVFLDAMEEKECQITIPVKYATSFWDEAKDSWISEKDEYEVLVGNSSQGPFVQAGFRTSKAFFWRGL